MAENYGNLSGRVVDLKVVVELGRGFREKKWCGGLVVEGEMKKEGEKKGLQVDDDLSYWPRGAVATP